MIARTPLLFILAAATSQLQAQDLTGPRPHGGPEAVKWFVEDEMVFPKDALDAGVDGEVIVGFVVRSSGEVTSVGVAQSLTPSCDAEARRLVKLVRWVPGALGGQSVDQEHVITIPFNAKRYERNAKRKDRCQRIEGPAPAASGDTVFTKELDSLATPLIDKGLRGLGAYLGTNLRYPEEARRRDIQGKVTIQFVVETSGTISNLRVLEFLGAGCDDEARRLARSMCWRPAIRKGHRVRSEVKLDIQFRLDHYQRP